ncbi:MAG: vanadium-dependent haloperoxidase [Alphaproteobacteria bacterium]|nr:vanadium-dependent haloperoxidase [Alphaproteobacteria bacterium]
MAKMPPSARKYLMNEGTRMPRQSVPYCGWRKLQRCGVLFGTVWLAAFVSSGSVRANAVIDVNNALLNIIQNTSAALVDGPPEVAREIALIDGAMFDAVNAASGNPYPPIVYNRGPVPGANPDAAALQAALTVMNSLYGPSSLYQQYEGVTGATYYPSIPAYKNALVGPTATQMNIVAAEISMINSELAALGSGHSVTAGIALGTAAGNAMLAVSANDGGYAASLQTLTPYVSPNEGNAGVYVPPVNRPAMTPTWGTVQPIGISSVTLAALEMMIPVAYATTSQGLASQAYALQVLQTECEGAGTGLPSNVANACSAAAFGPESAAEAQAALFWNDPGGTLQPPGHWLQIADTIAIQEELDLLDTARATATVGLALHAAGIGAWAIKYQDVAWRPVTAIQDCAAWSSYFSSCDAVWASLIALPPHPDYVAGHPAFSGAAATALAAVLGSDTVTFTSTSNAYCNGGLTTRDSLGNVVSCTLNGTVYSIAAAECANGGTLVYDAAGTVTGCTLTGIPQTVIGGGCNNAGLVSVLNSDYTANPAYNRSPLICPIAETYTSLSQASGGFLGAEFSRVVGGIHTPAAVVQALALGNAIGSFIVPVALTSGHSCDGNYNGVFNGNVTVLAGQNCVFTSPCEIKGNINVSGGSFSLACTADGNVTISGSSAFSLHAASIGNNLRIQSLSAGQPQGAVCGSMIKGNLVVGNNASPVAIGAANANACAGNVVGNNLHVHNNSATTSIDYNSISGNLQVDNDTATTDVSGNIVGNNLQCQNNTPAVTHIALNIVKGHAQGQCAAAP